MKKSILLALTYVIPATLMAQMAYWAIPPKYDKIEMALDDAILITDSAGVATAWSKEGNRLFATNDILNKYVEDKAVITTPNGLIKGYIDNKAVFHELPESSVAYNYPFFSDGYLCVFSGNGYGYFVPSSQQSEFLFHEKAYPFFNGYSAYMSYKQPEKKKDVYYNYHTTADKNVNYMLNGKKFEFRDIQFLSSIATDGRAIAVIKEKVYWFDANTGNFSPMYGGGIEDKKNQVTVDDKVLQAMESQHKEKVRFTGKYGKANNVNFVFDSMLRPDTIILDDKAITFTESPKAPYEYKSPLTVITENGKKGINYDGKKALPPQFDDISLLYDDYAFACFNGKWGLLKMLPDVQYSFILNNGKDIGFRHATYDTQLRLDLPKEISSNDVDFDVDQNSGCRLDKRFMESKDTRAGNFLQYNCELAIPENISSELISVTYPIQLQYKGINLYDYPLTAKAWHLKSYTVDIDEEDLTVKDGRAMVTIDIIAERRHGEPDYPFVVKAKSDSLVITSEKVSETRYTYVIDDLHNGINHVDIYVTEKGCPSAIFPLEINYVKPTKKNIQETIEVRKRDETHNLTSDENITDTVDTPPAEVPDIQAVPAPDDAMTDSIKDANLLRLLQ